VVIFGKMVDKVDDLVANLFASLLCSKLMREFLNWKVVVHIKV